VRHGCSAGIYQKALDVLDQRIFQIDDLGEQYYSLHNFGMHAEGLAAISGFFRERWSSLHSELNPRQQAHLLVVAGYCLRAVGDLEEASVATQLARDQYEILSDPSEAASAAGNLTQMLIASGRLHEALRSGVKAVELGKLCEDPRRRYERYNLAGLGDAYHQACRLHEAEECFKRSEQLQQNAFPKVRFLISYRGFLYCDLLLTLGRLDQVRERANDSLQHPKSSTHPAGQGLDHLSLGRSYLAEMPPQLHKASTHLEKAEGLVRLGGQLDELPRVLLALAELRLCCDYVDRAMKELRQARWLSERMGQNLRIIDTLIIQARVEFRSGKQKKARRTIEEGKELASAMGYLRGLKQFSALNAG
jgi:tetratricopeptide (TPR) repeat protein